MNFIGDKDKNKDNKLIGQGVYGCIYKPGIDCYAKYNNYNQLVTKIQILNFSSQNEISISKYIIDNIEKYNTYFSVILKNCTIDFTTLYNNSENHNIDLEKCNILEKYKKKYNKKNNYFNFFKENNLNDNKLILTYSKFINGLTFHKYFINLSRRLDQNIISNKQYLNIFILYLKRCLFSINLLSQYKIIHNDLHHHNIMIKYYKNYSKPIIIDFGEAFILNNDLLKIYNDYLNYNSYDVSRYWDSYHKRFLTYITKFNDFENYYKTNNLNNVDNFITPQIIDLFVKDIIDNDLKYYNKYITFFDKEQVEKLTTNLIQYFSQYCNISKYKKIGDVVSHIINSMLYTLDNYSITVNFIEVYIDNFTIIEKNTILFKEIQPIISILIENLSYGLNNTHLYTSNYYKLKQNLQNFKKF